MASRNSLCLIALVATSYLAIAASIPIGQVSDMGVAWGAEGENHSEGFAQDELHPELEATREKRDAFDEGTLLDSHDLETEGRQSSVVRRSIPSVLGSQHAFDAGLVDKLRNSLNEVLKRKRDDDDDDFDGSGDDDDDRDHHGKKDKDKKKDDHGKKEKDKDKKGRKDRDDDDKKEKDKDKNGRKDHDDDDRKEKGKGKKGRKDYDDDDRKEKGKGKKGSNDEDELGKVIKSNPINNVNLDDGKTGNDKNKSIKDGDKIDVDVKGKKKIAKRSVTVNVKLGGALDNKKESRKEQDMNVKKGIAINENITHVIKDIKGKSKEIIEKIIPGGKKRDSDDDDDDYDGSGDDDDDDDDKQGKGKNKNGKNKDKKSKKQ